MYRNEGPCAAAMKKSGLPRSDLFFTTKVYTKDMGYDKTKKSIAASLKETGLDYIDLYVAPIILSLTPLYPFPAVNIPPLKARQK